MLKTTALFVVTALAEILGCYLTYSWLRQGKSIVLLVPAALSLALFAWLLTFHPTAAGRTYAAYGGVYVSAGIGWLWLVEKQPPTPRDLLGVAICILGMLVIGTGTPPPHPTDGDSPSLDEPMRRP
ncbi:MAG TPA: YnfA family protein [Polyangiaceae bacterium]|nr:YnfA family protein [Polyangiaceae bacterium]